MTNWLERARREIQQTPDHPTAVTAVSNPHSANGSIGSTPSGGVSEIEGAAERPPSPPADLGALLTEACHGVDGIDAATFRALLSPEDIEDIEGGQYPYGDAQRLR